MNLIDFIKEYPDEAACKAKFKEYREQIGVICAQRGCSSHYWKKDKEQYECRQCKTRTTLRSGTVMHKSKLPYHYWFISLTMGKRDDEYILAGAIELDEGFFST